MPWWPHKKKRCRFLLDNETRCSKNALRGSSLCWWHYARATGLLVPVMFGLAVFLADRFYSQRSETRITERQTASETRIADGQKDLLERSKKSDYLRFDRPLPRVQGVPLMLAIGTNLLTIGPGVTFPWIGRIPLSFKTTSQGELLISGPLYDKHGRRIGRLEESRLYTLPIPELGFDVNWDDNALEIVDPGLNPILQARRINARTMYLEFSLYLPIEGDPDRIWLEDATESGFGGAVLPIGGEPRWPARRTRLFCYPGYEYPGQRAEACISSAEARE